MVTTSVERDGNQLQVASARGFAAKSFVELSDAVLDSDGEPGILVNVVSVEDDTLSLAGGLSQGLKSAESLKVRRWDQREETTGPDGAVPIQETPATAGADEGWIDLENGIQIRFAEGGVYRSGDYWLVPARAIGWPRGVAAQPRGMVHHYAPLGLVWWADDELTVRTCVCAIQPVSDCTAAAADLVGGAGPSRVRATGSPSGAPARRRSRAKT